MVVVGADPPEQLHRPHRRRKSRGAEAGAETIRELVVLGSEQPLPEGEADAEGAQDRQELLSAHGLAGLRDDETVAVCSGGRLSASLPGMGNGNRRRECWVG